MHGYRETAARHHVILQALRRDTHHHFAAIWQAWTPPVRHAFTTVALLTTNAEALQHFAIDLASFQMRLPELSPELNALELVGVLQKSEQANGWQIRQGVLLTWLWDELIKEMREEAGLGQWVNRGELDNRWTNSQRQQLQDLIHELLQTDSNVSISLIQTDGGAYIAGAVNANGDFVNRDKKIG
ncbi:MAG: hypothetical protein KDE31_21195 [Caldilineaceae bacterium]|nr:hypothetical protein [Caldilineaceae bacterium]